MLDFQKLKKNFKNAAAFPVRSTLDTIRIMKRMWGKSRTGPYLATTAMAIALESTSRFLTLVGLFATASRTHDLFLTKAFNHSSNMDIHNVTQVVAALTFTLIGAYGLPKVSAGMIKREAKYLADKTGMKLHDFIKDGELEVFLPEKPQELATQLNKNL